MLRGCSEADSGAPAGQQTPAGSSEGKPILPTPQSAVETLVAYRRRFEPLLRRFFVERLQAATGAEGDLVRQIADFTLAGGKRLRPAFMYAGYRCFVDADDERVVAASMCVELLHTFLLIHDDIMDGDDLRRNRPTVHRQYADRASAEACRSREEYGIAMAIIAGDYAAHMAMDLLASLSFPSKVLLRAIRKLGEVWAAVCHGQALDVAAPHRPVFTLQDAQEINRLKTSSYTIAGPLQLGGILAGATEEQLAPLDAYAVPLGQAFQLRDDVLGLYGDEAQTGKPVGSDLREGKRTVLILKALELASPAQARIIRHALGNGTITAGDVAAVRTVAEENGALDYCRALVSSLVSEARAVLPPSLHRDGRDFLVGIADYLARRVDNQF